MNVLESKRAGQIEGFCSLARPSSLSVSNFERVWGDWEWRYRPCTLEQKSTKLHYSKYILGGELESSKEELQAQQNGDNHEIAKASRIGRGIHRRQRGVWLPWEKHHDKQTSSSRYHGLSGRLHGLKHYHSPKISPRTHFGRRTPKRQRSVWIPPLKEEHDKHTSKIRHRSSSGHFHGPKHHVPKHYQPPKKSPPKHSERDSATKHHKPPTTSPPKHSQKDSVTKHRKSPTTSPLKHSQKDSAIKHPKPLTTLLPKHSDPQKKKSIFSKIFDLLFGWFQGGERKDMPTRHQVKGQTGVPID